MCSLLLLWRFWLEYYCFVSRVYDSVFRSNVSVYVRFGMVIVLSFCLTVLEFRALAGILCCYLPLL